MHVTHRIWLALEDLVTAEAARRESESDCQELVSLSQNPVCDEIYYWPLELLMKVLSWTHTYEASDRESSQRDTSV